jgi:hypothetical protein
MLYRAERAATGSEREADSRTVSPGFLQAIGARLHAGRFFSETDDVSAPPVVVDRRLADRAWPPEETWRGSHSAWPDAVRESFEAYGRPPHDDQGAPETLMISLRVVMRHELLDGMAEMALIDRALIRTLPR